MVPVLILAAVLMAASGGCAARSGSPADAGTPDRTAEASVTEASAAVENPSRQNGEMFQESDGAGKGREIRPGERQATEPAAEEEENQEDGGPGGPDPVKEPETLAGKTDRRKEIEAFAERIQEAVMDRNMEAMAELSSFPLEIVTSDGEDLRFMNRNEFLKQNPDLIFGDDLMMAIANIDTATLEQTADGVAMGETKGPHIRYVTGTDGSYGIVQIRE